MPPLNPFLRAFFRSTLPSQCSPVQNHILLVPTSPILLTSRDRESQALYTDLVNSEEFLASHVLRVPGAVTAPTSSSSQPNGIQTDEAAAAAAAANSFRENRTKAKQFTTLNGRTVIVKDSYAYSNKGSSALVDEYTEYAEWVTRQILVTGTYAVEEMRGFKHLNQAQLVTDAIYYPDAVDAQPWLIYYISRPLVGSLEPIKIVPATLEKRSKKKDDTLPNSPSSSREPSNGLGKKKDIKSFSEILNQFPMIARQMQPGLERIFKEFKREAEKPLPTLPTEMPAASSSRPRRSRQNSISSLSSLSNSLHSSLANGNHHEQIELSPQEDELRQGLEIAVTAAIDLFQMVDKQQLSLLGSSTDLTGAAVERMIEKYVTEQLHEQILFQRLCALRKNDDADLESKVRQMGDIDIAQVGLSTEAGHAGKRELSQRLSEGITMFKKIGVASGPHEMLETLLETQKIITKSKPMELNGAKGDSEKADTITTLNADTLVSLLLIVVIRSSVRHLMARSLYMRHFIFIDDVESGETGYALSTFEAVLSYLSLDSGGLRRSSLRNRRLWQATKAGNIAEMREVLEPDSVTVDTTDEESVVDRPFSSSGTSATAIKAVEEPLEVSEGPAVYNMMTQANGTLRHVFPFQRPETPKPHFLEPEIQRARMKKRVSVQSRSTSSSSGYSVRSLTLTIGSQFSGFEGDLSIETLVQTQGPDGESVLMMAVLNGQDRALQYLLSLEQYFPVSIVLEDEKNDGTTLFSAAIQSGNRRMTDLVLDYIIDHATADDAITSYLNRQDENGRSAAHYLFDYPSLITRIGHLIPWTLKDKNGQTPLFALCRSYDHEEYRWMVDAGMSAAATAQQTEKNMPKIATRLRLDDHVDNKGNTLLHIVNEPALASRMLRYCDSDVNAVNDKHFTPLMVASKYGRTEMVRALFNDPRVDLYARDLRGLTATELAKDDEVRNKIDDLMLLLSPPGPDQRITTVIRSFFIEDGTVRLIVKSAAPTLPSTTGLNGDTAKSRGTVTVTTIRRTVGDFETLARHLALEHPASWLPYPSSFLNPFLIPSKPARSVARDTQLRLDAFFKALLSHSTFAQHEMVWEFFLVPDMAPDILEDRAKRKAELRLEMIKEEFLPATDVRDVELFASYAKDSVRGTAAATKSVLRRTNALITAQTDIHTANTLAAAAVSTLIGLPDTHKTALQAAANALKQLEFPPTLHFYYATLALSTSLSALLRSLSRPADLIARHARTKRDLDRATATLRRSTSQSRPSFRGTGVFALPPLTDASRKRAVLEQAKTVQRLEEERDVLGAEIGYTRQVVAMEMAAWQEGRVGEVREVCRAFAARSLVVERERLESLRRALRPLGIGADEVGERGEERRARMMALKSRKAGAPTGQRDRGLFGDADAISDERCVADGAGSSSSGSVTVMGGMRIASM